MDFKIPFFKIHHGPEEEEALLEVAHSGWWSTGKKTAELEQWFADYVGARYVIFVDSGTRALFLALNALGIKDKTFKVPSLTFTASAAEIVHSCSHIEFIDVDRETLCVSGDYEGPLMKVHYGGNFSKASGVPTVEDSAHLIKKDQCRDNPNLVCFSLAYNKNATAAEGGLVATNDQRVYDWLVKARFFGERRFNLLGDSRHPDWPYEVEFLGWKGNTSEFHAALGLVQLKKLEKLNGRRKQIVDYYNQAFSRDWQGLHLYPVFVSNRPTFLQKMRDAGIQCSVHYIPLHWMRAYQGYKVFESLNNTEWFGRRLVTIPLYPDLTDGEVEYITQQVRLAAGKGGMLVP